MVIPVPGPGNQSDRCSGSGLELKFKRTVSNREWVDEEAPFPGGTFHYSTLLWFPILAVIAIKSIHLLNDGQVEASVFWIMYESYILFDHAPFLVTDGVYKSPNFNYRYVEPTFFWGMEAIASIVSVMSNIGAPLILLYNAAPHSFFVVAHYNGTPTSKAFVKEQMKSWYILAQVCVDTTIHATSLWYHIKYLSSINNAAVLGTLPLWIVLVASMLVLTYVVHRDEIRFSYFFDTFRA